jgi:hypothetical protein
MEQERSMHASTARMPAVVAAASSPLMRVLGSSWLLGAVVGLISWPALFVTPSVGLDPSWGTALSMASARGLDFGGEVIWTYGPLGFLRVPQVAYGTHAVLGAAYMIAVQIALGTTLVWSARRMFPLPIAVAIALLAAMLVFEPIVAIALIWCVVVLGDEPPPVAVRLFPLAAGIVSAIELLGKLNIGLLVVAMCGVSVVAMDGARRRNTLTFAASLALALAVLWFGTGQGLGDLGDEVSASAAIVTGYSAGLVRESAPLAALYVWSLALLVTSVLAAYLGGRDLPLGRRVATLIVVGLAAFGLWKQAVVRHEVERSLGLFTVLVGTVFAFQWRKYRLWRGDDGRIAALAAFTTVLAAAAAYISIAPWQIGDRLDPVQRTDRAITQVADLLIPAERRQARDASRSLMDGDYAIDPKTRRLVGGNTVEVQPWEAGIAWAYDLDWRPVPVFQTYQAYTSDLDQRNADALTSDGGPQRILRHLTGDGYTLTPSSVEGRPRSELQEGNTESVDGRYSAYDTPAVAVAMLCHFAALRTTRTYQVLSRVPDRCDEPRPLGSHTAGYGEPIEVPPAPGRDDVVIARVHGLEPTGIERLRTFLFRAATRSIVFDGRAEYRMVPGTATDGLIMSAPPRVDFPRPFALAPNAGTIEFRKESSWTSPDAELTVEFLAIPVRSPG